MNKKKFGLLSQIQYPADLRKISEDQLPEVCSELRQDIIDEVSVNPGHLASSLGVVELTVALHYVFNTPDDRIVWDVGHQAYGHKILTGRRDRFCTNRQLGGIRPFPTPWRANTTRSPADMHPTASRLPSAWPWPQRWRTIPSATSWPSSATAP